ncbi:MAG TPA: altronate hydrolase, partial [Bacteroidales bacterium]|nr:altronate hydrolase [Bacteroidales bacterium]
MKDFIRINTSDNVVVALNEINKGIILDDIEATKILEDIKPGHKIATEDICKGENIVKYGYPIGHATENIKKGQWVHTHNIRTNLDGTLEYNYKPNFKDIKKINRPKTFMGYKRKNEDVGIRNELLVVPTVGCINGIAEMIVREFKNKVNLENIDDCLVYKHNYGCSQLGDDLENTRRILADIVK